MAKFVRAHHAIKMFKCTHVPQVKEGLKKGDIWVDTSGTPKIKVCSDPNKQEFAETQILHPTVTPEVKFLVNFMASGQVLYNAYNVLSVTNHGIADYTINLDKPVTDGYVIMPTLVSFNGDSRPLIIERNKDNFRIQFVDHEGHPQIRDDAQIAITGIGVLA